MRPVDVLTLSPGGSPLALKLVGLWVAVIWYVIGLPTPPTAELALVMTGGPNVMLKVTPRLPVPVPLVANTVALNVPVAVGVPEMRPVAVFTVTPGGSPLALYDVGAYVAVIW